MAQELEFWILNFGFWIKRIRSEELWNFRLEIFVRAITST